MPRYSGGAFWPYAFAHQPGGWAEQSKSFSAPTWPLSPAILLTCPSSIWYGLWESEREAVCHPLAHLHFFMPARMNPSGASVSEEISHLLMPCLTV